MSPKIEEEQVLQVEALVREEDFPSEAPSIVQVWLMAEPDSPPLAVQGHVVQTACPSTVVQDDGQRLIRVQIELPLDEVLCLWTSMENCQGGPLPQIVKFARRGDLQES
jgi:hypothetical protein